MSSAYSNNEKLSREELLEQRKELLSSIKYASFIQEAILPDNRYLDKVLNEHFILYLPRDIVSGDFYFCTKIENFVIVAAGDCTGHGVPGALMSFMGVSFLNEILSGRGPWKASRILNLLRERVMKALHQTGGNEENKDAMDMALCVFNEDSGELQYSGANNPLYHVRKGELKEIRADKMPVGINAVDEESFTNHTVRLISDDMIYMFSDGYPDQFGGEYCKKFKYTPLKNLLIEISGMELDKQEDILKERFYAWKGTNEQVDDILIFGIKFL